MCFPVKFAKYFRAPFFTEHLRWLLLLLDWPIAKSVNLWWVSSDCHPCKKVFLDFFKISTAFSPSNRGVSRTSAETRYGELCNSSERLKALNRSCKALHLRRFVNSLTTNVPYHIETSQLICNANQLTGFYMMGNIGR